MVKREINEQDVAIFTRVIQRIMHLSDPILDPTDPKSYAQTQHSPKIKDAVITTFHEDAPLSDLEMLSKEYVSMDPQSYSNGVEFKHELTDSATLSIDKEINDMIDNLIIEYSGYSKYSPFLPTFSRNYEGQPTADMEFHGTRERVNHWLLQKLRGSRVENSLLYSIMEETQENLRGEKDANRWKTLVLENWNHDGAGAGAGFLDFFRTNPSTSSSFNL